jgi:hypothetical protein
MDRWDPGVICLNATAQPRRRATCARRHRRSPPEVPIDSARAAIQARSSFNLIDTTHGLKVDLFVLGEGLLDRMQIARRMRITIPGVAGGIWVTSAVDQVLRTRAGCARTPPWSRRRRAIRNFPKPRSIGGGGCTPNRPTKRAIDEPASCSCRAHSSGSAYSTPGSVAPLM